MPVERQIVIGRMGDCKFREGYYAYTGSAFGKGAISLGGRILRHLKKEKKKKWHIDYLLSGDNAIVTAVIAAYTKGKMECVINCYLRDKLQAEVPVLGFGSTDCKERCRSHLLYLGGDKNIVRRIAELYSEKTDAEICIFDFH